MAQAVKPSATRSCSACCSRTASGVVSPLPCSAAPGAPMPSVPTIAQRRPSACNACAVHHMVDVLPLVPVAATTFSRALGRPRNRWAIGPASSFRCGTAAMRGSSKPKPPR